MISRREALLGGSMAVAAGAAYALEPRERLSLLGSGKLEDMIPKSFGSWQEYPSQALVVPQSDDSLAAKLYSQTVGRLYVNNTGQGVMLLIAYGDTQSDQLQLHRPEVCYPAFGFNVVSNEASTIELATGIQVPSRDLHAVSSIREENISYWTRIGEYIPESGNDQRWAKLRSAFAGIIPDGVLVRVSNAESDRKIAFTLNRDFARAMMSALAPDARRALIGSDRSSQFKSAKPVARAPEGGRAKT